MFVLAVGALTFLARCWADHVMTGCGYFDGLRYEDKYAPKKELERVYDHSIWVGNSEVKIYLLKEIE